MGAVNPTVIQNQPAFHPDQRTDGDIFLQGLESLGKLAVGAASIKSDFDKNEIEQAKNDTAFAKYLSESKSPEDRRTGLLVTGRDPNDPKWAEAMKPWNAAELQDQYNREKGQEFAAMQRQFDQQKPASAPADPAAPAPQTLPGTVASPVAKASPLVTPTPSTPAINKVLPMQASPQTPGPAKGMPIASTHRAQPMAAPQASQMVKSPAQVQTPALMTLSPVARMPQAAQPFDMRMLGKKDPNTGQFTILQPEAIQEFQQTVLPHTKVQASIVQEAVTEFDLMRKYMQIMMGNAAFGNKEAMLSMQSLPEEYRMAMVLSREEGIARLQAYMDKNGAYDWRFADRGLLSDGIKFHSLMQEAQAYNLDPKNVAAGRKKQYSKEELDLIQRYQTNLGKLSMGARLAIDANSSKQASDLLAAGVNAAQIAQIYSVSDMNFKQSHLFELQGKAQEFSNSKLPQKWEQEYKRGRAEIEEIEARTGIIKPESEARVQLSRAQAFSEKTGGGYAAILTALGNEESANRQQYAAIASTWREAQAGLSDLFARRSEVLKNITIVNKHPGVGGRPYTEEEKTEARNQLVTIDQQISRQQKVCDDLMGQMNVAMSKVNLPTFGGRTEMAAALFSDPDLSVLQPGNTDEGAMQQYYTQTILDGCRWPSPSVLATINNSGQKVIDPTDSYKMGQAILVAMAKGQLTPDQLRSLGPEDWIRMFSKFDGLMEPIDDAWASSHDFHMRDFQSSIANEWIKAKAYSARLRSATSAQDSKSPANSGEGKAEAPPKQETSSTTSSKQETPPLPGPGTPGVARPQGFAPSVQQVRAIRTAIANNVPLYPEKGRWNIIGPYAGYSNLLNTLIEKGWVRVYQDKIEWNTSSEIMDFFDRYNRQDANWSPPIYQAPENSDFSELRTKRHWNPARDF